MNMSRVFGVLALLPLLFLVGCQRTVLKVDKEFELSGATNEQRFTIDPIKKEQTIHVNVTADNPVGVYVGIQKDAEDVGKEALSKKFTDKTLAKQSKETNVSLDATIPPNTEAHIIVLQ